MDKAVRDAIATATQRARRLLEEDIASQLEATFDILPTGAIASTGGPHLSEREHSERSKIVAAIDHKRAAGMSAAEAVGDYIRDAAFTTLNRFVALKMLEARDLVQECVSKGEQSSGYREFCGMASGLALLPGGAGYRLYVESLFDELSTEVKVLFDRRDLAAVIWPRRQAFAALLSVLNDPELSEVWAEDETLGWVYQYFNSWEERRELRDASQAPRNSRELAIRNQFFTPRYVVQFLTDNTLGRTWHDMRGGDTKLVERCEYLVPRLGETLESRAKKDPRDLKILDPACGSGHFLLYSFDLLCVIYEEGWTDPNAPPSAFSGRTLRQDYSDLEAMRSALPGLILRHNLHGVDIDPRCAQIAQLSLWMRAQRAFRDYGIGLSERPAIRRVNIVTAEPMPGERELLEEFLRGLKEDRLEGLLRRTLKIPADRNVRATKGMADSLAELVTAVWNSMRLAGEMGSLLKIDRDLQAAVEQGRAEWEGRLPLFRVIEYGLEHGVVAPVKENYVRLVPGEQDDFWNKAESLVLQALADYADSATAADTTRRRLFADDAARGFAFADLIANRFDIVLMNPAFGDPIAETRDALRIHYNDSRSDLSMAFVERGVSLAPAGSVGAITTRTFLANDALSVLRRKLFLGGQTAVEVLADLGYGVLDGAMVETAAYAIGTAANSATFFNLLAATGKEKSLRTGAHRTDWPLSFFFSLPGSVICHWVDRKLLEAALAVPTIQSSGSPARVGLQTGDNYRFVRTAWEAPAAGIGKKWYWFAKGGEYEPFYDDIHLVVNWAEEGKEIRCFEGASRPQNVTYYFQEGITYPDRTTSDFSPRIMPRGVIFSDTGRGLFPAEREELLGYLGMAYTRPFKVLIEAMVGAGDSSVSGSAARHYRPGVLNALPNLLREPGKGALIAIENSLCERMTSFSEDETARWFTGFGRLTGVASLKEAARKRLLERVRRAKVLIDFNRELEEEVWKALDLTRSEECVACEFGTHPTLYAPATTPTAREIVEFITSDPASNIEAVRRQIGGGRFVMKKSFIADRSVELACHLWSASPQQLLTALESGSWEPPLREIRELREEMVSALIGVAFGRFHVDRLFAREGSHPDPFAEFPALSPASDSVTPQVTILVDDPGHSRDISRHLSRIIDGITPTQPWAMELQGAIHEVHEWLRFGFFEYHVQGYSKSRRKAPIYWQLATPSASYSVWLYIHAFTRDTLFQVQNDYVAPKLQHETARLETMRSEAGPDPAAQARRELSAQETFVNELRAFLDEVKLVAPLWKPDLNDGVVINFAPLWRLVAQHRAWQREVKATWGALCGGAYDWAHLAMHLWPERVVPKCADDRSLAIAHDLEDLFWEEDDDGKWQPRPFPLRPVEALVRERSSPAVKAALQGLLEAPVVGLGNGRGRVRAGQGNRR
jgi:hypothetical protein